MISTLYILLKFMSLGLNLKEKGKVFFGSHLTFCELISYVFMKLHFLCIIYRGKKDEKSGIKT